ncbi:DUF2141 domain-containing protein [Thalassotalea marina]|uniref:DUF2141 domain-containing protein n=1 Tax=Thalassotalea marina TaxID=1673741 RepID=A0A919BTA1_9GAMM|nr:DUF2141 domain-containing protein [Thalassotalea marina]GHG08237.1 hypothetical protein GCM10017161_42520 [Thalassotalea marina]
MKRMTLLTTLSLAFASNIALANSVTFTIEQVKNDKGTILAQLFKGATNYKAGKAVSAQQVKAKQGSISITFNNLEPGEYAIRYFHDENNNGKLETNMFGMPTEGYGYSNNAKGNFGPADYNDMKFTVSTTPITTQSTVSY